MSLGITEILLILVVIVLLFGGKKIPEIYRSYAGNSSSYRNS